ncbi:MAG: non-ribosomal peptide synthetase [Chloroflexota bacterium]
MTKSQSPTWQQTTIDKCVHPTGVWTPFPDEERVATLHQRFFEIVAQSPDAIAIEDAQQQYTYQQLAYQAAGIAYAIRQASPEYDTPVAIFLDDSPHAIAAMLGVWMAGRFYTIINKRLPDEQMRYIVQDSKTSLVLTNTDDLSLTQRLIPPHVSLLNIDTLPMGDERLLTALRCRMMKSASPAWLCYTSGSTGTPKGVLQTHGNVLHFVRNDTNDMHICAQDRFALLSSLNTNIAGHMVANALLNGASLFLWNLRNHSAEATIDWLNQRQITHLWIAPTVATHLFEAMHPSARLEHVRVLLLIGETTHSNHLDQFHRHLKSRCVLVNRYGSSETGAVCRYFLPHERQINTDSVPVGYATDGHELFLVDDHHQPVKMGETGEIVVRSRYLSPGYWHLPERTAEVFATDPKDPQMRTYYTGDLGCMDEQGCLMHLGRKDYQIKIAANKVHVQAVEACLVQHPQVASVAVWPYVATDKTQRLAAYIVPTDRQKPTSTALRTYLAEHLPTYAIPTRFQYMDALPTTANGKLYRPALPPPQSNRPTLDVAYAPPQTPIEIRIAEIWQTILDLSTIGIHDPFLDLGGDSLQATRIASHVMHEFSVEIGLGAFFVAATVAEMAVLVVTYLVEKERNNDIAHG